MMLYIYIYIYIHIYKDIAEQWRSVKKSFQDETKFINSIVKPNVGKGYSLDITNPRREEPQCALDYMCVHTFVVWVVACAYINTMLWLEWCVACVCVWGCG